jgi:hypothetical protein
MSETFRKLAEHFPPGDVRKRPGRGGIELSWVEARVVTDRLNSVLGVDAWSFSVPEVVSSGSPSVIKARLEVFRPDGSVAVREDFGYSTGGSGEDLKEAVSDGLRRVASLVGVSSYLYAHSQGSEAPQTTSTTILAPQTRDVVSAATEMFADNSVEYDMVKAAQKFVGKVDGGTCRVHNKPWTLRPGGVSSRTGKEFKPFYTCTQKTADGWCKEKPSQDWLQAQEDR